MMDRYRVRSAVCVVSWPCRLLVLGALLVAGAGAVYAQAASRVAYVTPQAQEPGKRGATATPFASVRQALAAGARELYLAPGVYPEGVLLFTTGGTVTLHRWEGRPGSVEIQGDVILEGGTTVVLHSNALRLLGDLHLHAGTLTLRDASLDIHAPEGATRTMFVGRAGAVQGSGTCDLDVLRYTGADTINVVLETTDAQLRFDFPCIEIEMEERGSVTFDASGLPATTMPPTPPNRLDVLGTPRFTVISAADSTGVRLLDGLDQLDIDELYVQQGAGLLMAGRSSRGAGATQPTVQTLRALTSFSQEDGAFFATGGDVQVGDFFLGRQEGQSPSTALFSLAPEGTHTVMGAFRVAPDVNPNDRAEGAFDPLERNRYFLGDGRLTVYGDYRFEGTGDRFDDLDFLEQNQGLDGEVIFAGLVPREMAHRQDEDAFFEDVTLAGPGGLQLRSNGWQNFGGTLTLHEGIISAEEKAYSWVIVNTGFEADLGDRNNGAPGRSVVALGSRESHIETEVVRILQHRTDGVSSRGGYLFPVGTHRSSSDICAEPDRRVDYFRPLILEFPADLGTATAARVTHRDDLTDEDVDFPEEGIVVDAVGEGTLTLDVISDMFWQLEFDQIPAFDPSIRIEADDLANIFDIESLRLVQWDCDGTNPRLAGPSDVSVPASQYVQNTFIDAVPNLTQEGVEVQACQLIGIASNFLINPLGLEYISEPLVRVQFIHTILGVDSLDVYIDDSRVLNDFPYLAATPFFPLPVGAYRIDLVAADQPDNAAPLWSSEQRFAVCTNQALMAVGDQATLDVVTQEGVLLEAASEDTEFLIVHAAPDAPSLDVRLLAPRDSTDQVIDLLVNNISFGEATDYRRLAPAEYLFEITDADNDEAFARARFDLHDLGGQTLILVLTGSMSDGSMRLTGYDVEGEMINERILTSTDAVDARPEAFAVRGNYPNPFHAATRIVMDLPEAADVHVEVFDVLGRLVRRTEVRRLHAGSNRMLDVDASALAPGTYLYRVVARTGAQTLQEAGRMVLMR